MQKYEAANGAAFPRFDSEEQAEAAAKSRSASGGAAAGNAIVMDENYKAGDAFGLFGGATNPLEVEAKATAQARADAAAAEAQRVEQERVTAETDANNRSVDALIAERNGRCAAVSESKLPEWQKQWDEKNRSSGIAGDFFRRAGSTSHHQPQPAHCVETAWWRPAQRSAGRY